MKTRLGISKLLIVLSSVFTTMAGFCQTTYTWTGAGDGVTFDSAANWTPAGGPPSPQFGDTARWDGLTRSNLVLNYTGTTPSFSGSPGANFVLTANQTNSVMITYFTANGVSGNFGLNNITINGPGGAFALGDANGSVNNAVLNIVTRPSGATHDWINNSTNPCIVYPNVRWQAGGGAVYKLVFDGTGDWLVTNDLRCFDTGVLLAKQGSGTWIWNGPSIPNAAGPGTINNPLVIGGGTLILKWGNSMINNVAITNNALLEYDAPTNQTLNGSISGTGNLQVNNGTLRLGGQNTYTGNTLLSGGELIANSMEWAGTSGPLGVTNTISFTGGTLGFSVSNVFDYSGRFSTAAGQAYSFNTAGQNVTFATGLGSSIGTLTKLGAGALTLSGTSSYSGATAVNAGKLVFQGSKTGTNIITVADGAALGVTATGTQVAPDILSLGSSSGCTLEFNNVNSTTTAPLAANNLSSAGTITINVNSGTLAIGQCYPLLTWNSGAAPTVSLGVSNGYLGNLSFNGNTLYLCITAVVPPTLNLTNLGNSLQFSWDTSFGDFKLQSQTNSFTVGLGTNWVDYPGGDTSPVTVPMDAMQATVFFRLVSAP